jgi:signal transduction histidine kinase
MMFAKTNGLLSLIQSRILLHNIFPDDRLSFEITNGWDDLLVDNFSMAQKEIQENGLPINQDLNLFYQDEVWNINNCEDLIKGSHWSQLKSEEDKVVVETREIENTTYDYLQIKLNESRLACLSPKVDESYMRNFISITNDLLDDERRRIAFDIHDSAIQFLSGVKFMVNGLRENPESLSKILPKLEKAINDAILELRTISYNLMPAKIEEQGLYQLLVALEDRLQNHYGVKLDLKTNVDFAALSVEFQTSVYRIIQELCSNAIKHGKAQELVLFIKKEKNELILDFEDNGIGFHEIETARSRMGLANIFYRVGEFQGKIKLDTNSDIGVKYSLEFPIEKIERL